MGLSPYHVLVHVIRPALTALGPRFNSPAAERLLLGTGAHESGGFRYLIQLPNGPAVGLWQMEPFTFRDLRDRVVAGNEPWQMELRKGVMALYTHVPPQANDLIANLPLAAAFCRIKYASDPHPLPDADDVQALANYWKRVYNTPAGKGKPSDFIDAWQKYVIPALDADKEG